jgi:GGDEF domain-containing protein
VILVHYPHAEERIGGQPTPEALWNKTVQEGGGYYRSPADMNGMARLVAVRPLREFPLVIDASTSEAAALSGWHRHALWLAMGALFAAAWAILLLRVFGVQYGRLAAQNAQMETSQLQFDAVLDNMSQGIKLFDGDQNLLVCNRRFVEMYGLSADQTRPGTSLLDIISHRRTRGTFPPMPPAEYTSRARHFIQATKSFELIDELPDGRAIFLHSQPLGGSGGWVSTHEDITDRRRAEAALAFMARHDALTQLPNRTLFQERVAEAVAMARTGTHCALLCLELDRFKANNDTLGHPVGDGLLRAVAGRLSAAVRDVDTVARLGGDEFAIIQVGLSSSEESGLLAGRILGAVCQPYDIDGHKVVAGMSVWDFGRAKGWHLIRYVAEECRYRAVSGEDRGGWNLPLLRTGNGCAGAGTARGRVGASQRVAGGSFRPALSARAGSSIRQRHRIRGADTVEPSRPRRYQSGGLHSDRRGIWPYRSGWGMGTPAGLRGSRGLAARHRHRDQSLTGAVQGRPTA